MQTPNQLIDDLLDGELPDEGFRELEGWLSERDEHVRQFATAWLLHSLLHDFISQRQVQADALLRAMATTGSQVGKAGLSDVFECSTGSARRTIEPQSRRTPESVWTRLAVRRFGLASLAGLLLVTVAAGVLVNINSRPRVVAMLTQSANCRWVTTGGDIADGALLHEGDELRLAEGMALLTFASGARVVIEGPTRLTVQSQLAAEMTEGNLTAKVPPQAIGFTIHTRGARYVDLGTEFSVRSRADGSFELQVFEGMVELTAHDEAPLRISEGTGVKVAATSRSVESIPYDERRKNIMP